MYFDYRQNLEKISAKEFEQFITGGQVLSTNKYHDKKVVLSPSGIIYKMYYLKRLLSSALFKPYAKRFVDNTNELNRRGVQTAEIKAVYHIPEMKRYVVAYKLLEGISLREYLAQSTSNINRLESTAQFMAELHQKGIYFRSVHFGNIMILSNASFGLIDLAAVKFYRTLSPWQRARNFKTILRYKEDRDQIIKFGLERFFDLYYQAANFSKIQKQVFQFLLKRYYPKLF